MTHAVSRYRRVLVPLDGSRLAEGIIPFVVDIAEPHADLSRRGIRVRTLVCLGTPTTAILAVAREGSADLIAMTTHGRSGFSRLLFGSVAEAVLRQGEFPMFLMRLTAVDAPHEGGQRSAAIA